MDEGRLAIIAAFLGAQQEMTGTRLVKAFTPTIRPPIRVSAHDALGVFEKRNPVQFRLTIELLKKAGIE